MIDCYLLGAALAHTRSPEIHAMLGGYRYEALELSPGAFDEFVRARRFRGANVTIPYKRRALQLCDRLSTEARALGNVNTLVVEADGSLTGHNTDHYGFLRMVERSGLQAAGKKAAVLGSGGAGQTCRFALQRLGARVVTVSRAGPVDYESLYSDHADIEILVNATPAGMFPDVSGCPADVARLPRLTHALDLIYNPPRTRLLRAADARGIRAENGLFMLVAQAAKAAELFTGQPVTEALMERVYRQLRQTEESP